MDVGPSFGQWLKARRRALDLTQDALAERVGCAGETIRKIEAGGVRPSRQLAELIAVRLNLLPDEQAAFSQWARGAAGPSILLGEERGDRLQLDPGTVHVTASPMVSSSAGHASRAALSVAPVTPPQSNKLANPYKGLRAFREADAQDYFGRETLIDRLVARLSETTEFARFLAVVGPSGSGKSSLVRAGLLPAIRAGAIPGSQNWRVVEVIPGSQPLEELEAALLRVAVNPPGSLLEQLQQGERGLLRAAKRVLPDEVNAELLLLIDQFEEVFTLVTDEEERVHLLDNLYVATVDSSSRLRIVITLRADFYDRPLLYPQIGELLRTRTEAVLPMSVEDLERAILLPAERVGAQFEPDLAATIISDVGGEPGMLPLLEYALTDLFERIDGPKLTLAAYRGSGGVHLALGRRAEEIYTKLSQKEQEMTRQLFLRLVTLGEGTDDTRRRVRVAEITSLTQKPDSMERVIERFARYRLLTLDRDPVAGGPTVEVAHEALLRSWWRLRDWLAASRERLHVQRRLATSVAEWQKAGQDASFLASGARLAQFAILAAESGQEEGLALTKEEQEYLTSSLNEQRRHEAAEQEQQAREVSLHKRAASRLRYLVVGLAVFLLTVAILTTWAQTSEQNARANLAHASALRLADDANGLLLTHGDNQLIALLSIRSLNIEYSPLADAALAGATTLGYPARQFVGSTEAINGVSFSPDGRYLAGGDGKTVRLWDVATGQTVRIFSGHTDIVSRVHFSPDGKYLATASHDGTARLWDVATGNSVHILLGHMGWVTEAVFSPDGKYLATSSYDGTVRIWDVASGELSIPLGHSMSRGVHDVAFSPDGKDLLTGLTDTTARVWEAHNAMQVGAGISVLSGHTGIVEAVAFSPDGKYLATASDDKTAWLWDAATAKNVRIFSGHSAAIRGIAFSPDSKYLLTGSDDSTARLWDVATGRMVRIFASHKSRVDGVAFTGNGKWVATGSVDGTAMLWPVYSPAGEIQFIGHSGAVWQAAFSRDGKQVVTAGEDHTARLWDPLTGEEKVQMTVQLDPLGYYAGNISAAVFGAEFSPDSKNVLTASHDRDARLWDVATGKLARQFTGTDVLTAAAFSPDGKYILTTISDGTARLWDVDTGSIAVTFSSHATSAGQNIAFSHTGEKVVIRSDDNTAHILDPLSARELIVLHGHTAAVNGLAFSSTDKYVLTASDDGTARLWDVVTGAEVRRFIGHAGAVTAVAFSPDDRYVLSGGVDRTVRLWDLQTGNELRRFTGHSDAVRSVAFSPDGKSILTASIDGTARLWHTNYQETVHFLCSLLSRDLTPEERAQYNITDNQPTCSRP